MSKIVILFTVLISLITISAAELPRSNGYHINRPNSPFTLPIRSNYRVKSKLSLPLRQYGTPIGVETQQPPSPNYYSPNFARNPLPSNGFDLGLQLPTQTTTTIQPEYSNENPSSVESFEDNQNGPEPELGRLINQRNQQQQQQKSAKQEVDPNVTFQFKIPQTQNGFAHALAVYNPQQQQQQLIARYQTAPNGAILAQPQTQLVQQYQTAPAAALLAQPQTQLVQQYQTAPAAALLAQPQQQLVQQYQTAPARALLAQPQQQLVQQYQTAPAGALLAQPKQQFVQQYQTAPAGALLAQPQQQFVQQYETAPAGTVLAQPEQLLAQYQPIATATAPVTQYQLAAPVVQQQVYGNLHTQAILHPEYYQVQPAFQVAQPAVQIGQPIQPAVQVSEVEPITEAVAGQLPTGEPFSRATTGKLRAQPTLNQQYRRQQQQFLGKLQNAPARQIVEEQNQGQPPKGFAYAAIGF